MNVRHPLVILASLLFGGCATPGVSKIDPITAPPEVATTDYWFAQPPSVTVTAGDYDVLYRACENVLRARYFPLERRDYRNGVLTTRPVEGGQLLELWRRDIPDAYSVAESNLQSVRRTVQFKIQPTDDGFQALPKVVVERQALLERRVTLGILNRNAFSGASVSGYNDYDPNVSYSPVYWYATRRDENLEAQLAADLRGRLRQ